MPQKNHEKAAEHHEEAAKHHRNAAKQASEGNHEKAAHHAQAAQGHHKKASEYAGKAAGKFAEKAGTMKKEDGNQEKPEMKTEHNGNGRVRK